MRFSGESFKTGKAGGKASPAKWPDFSALAGVTARGSSTDAFMFRSSPPHPSQPPL